MRVIDFKVMPIDRDSARVLVEKYHYSKSLNGVMSRFCFGLFCGNELIGAAVYAGLGMANAWKKYADNPDDVIELRRLVCVDEAPKNSESRLVGMSLRWLRQNTDIKKVVSYADPNHGHQGIIYKATNFKYLGLTSSGKVIEYQGKQWHDKAIRTKYNGKLKPFAVKLKQALENGDAVYRKTQGKHIYVFDLNH